MQDRVNLALAPTAAAAGTLSAASLLAIALTALGLFGAVAHTVGRRTYEIGVRRALGAPSAAIALAVTRDVAASAGVGIGCGLIGAALSGQALRSLLYQTGGVNPLVLGAAAIVLMLVCLAAVALPTWRALRVNPAAALRHE
jgi:ABC-type antimicrobial peptide transport system permease subunit